MAGKARRAVAWWAKPSRIEPFEGERVLVRTVERIGVTAYFGLALAIYSEGEFLGFGYGSGPRINGVMCWAPAPKARP